MRQRMAIIRAVINPPQDPDVPVPANPTLPQDPDAPITPPELPPESPSPTTPPPGGPAVPK